MLMAGIGSSSKTIIIAFAVFFPIFMNTYQSIRLVPQEYIEVGNIFAFSRVRLLWKVIIPSALPGIFVGVRYSAGLSWAMIVGADMLGGTKGLGYLLMRAQDLLMIDQLFVVIFVIGFVGFIIDTALAYLQRWLLAWKRESVR
jgi:sulfonate transport system permease protein